ncbi:virulence protein [Mycoplasma struthionis]|uniref:Virulence protein n=1 Tax=Mycoplasma struthionis TaxID=538220 RepID=A0A3G8LH33_9MOLU|nr:virulence protein [Mycoplasma struthionis]AZG68545.1 virulence protein [Mycoplasma struthionis]TPI02377.1 virulence protein [Mycoplasma struthionis]
MYGLVFYLNKEKLIASYKKESHKEAYEDIRNVLRHFGFHWLSNSFYFSRSLNALLQTYKAIEELKNFAWFKESLVSFHIFKMEDLSNFTEYITGEEEK